MGKLNRFFFWGPFSFQAIFGHDGLEAYFSYLKQLKQPCGHFQEGEIEVVTAPESIAQIQKAQESRLLKKGFSPEDAAEFSRVGVVREDQYWVWLRDAVYFPQGIPGTYDRLVWKSALKSDAPGVAVLPVLPSGRVVLNLNYRHATRSWELELPRGAVQSQESLEKAACREVREETGLILSSVTFLGHMTPDSGVLSSVIPIFIGKVATKEEANPEYSEAIADGVSFSKEELREGFVQGFLEVSLGGERRQVPLRDSFLAFALLQAEIRQLL